MLQRPQPGDPSSPNSTVADFSGGETLNTSEDWSNETLTADWPAEYVVPDASAPGVSVYSAKPGGTYAEETGYPLQIQWTLLEGVNDGLHEARRLGELLRGRRGIVNFIPFNAIEGSGFRRPPLSRCVEMVRAVKSRGGMASLRFSAAQEVDGGCGQLRARRLARET